MINIGDILQQKILDQQKDVSVKKKGIINKRQFILSEFQFEINKERINGKFKMITGAQIGVKLSHLSLQTLEWFLSVCRDYKNRHGSFSKIFFGALKPK